MYNTGRWTPQEHELFLEALRIYGKVYKKIESHVMTRDPDQIRAHAQKFIQKLLNIVNGQQNTEIIDNAELYMEIL